MSTRTNLGRGDGPLIYRGSTGRTRETREEVIVGSEDDLVRTIVCSNENKERRICLFGRRTSVIYTVDA